MSRQNTRNTGLRKALRLHPEPRSLDASRIYEDLNFHDKVSKESGIPYVVINAVSTLDGKVSKDGTSSGIGSKVDRSVMRTIRSRVDAVLVGAGTIRAEKLSLTVTEELEDWRISHGKSAQPLGVILSREGKNLNPDILKETTPNLLLLTEGKLYKSHKQRGLLEKGYDLKDYLELLKEEYCVKSLLVEGGPTVNHSLFREHLVSELFLTLSPKVYGGNETHLVEGNPIDMEGETEGYELLSLYSYGNELFLRYQVL